MQFTPVIAFGKRDYLLVWKLVEYTFNHYTNQCKGVRYERSKQTVNASQEQYKIPSCLNDLLRQADYMRRNSLLIKNTKNDHRYQKLHYSNGNIFSFILHLCYFSYLPWIAASEGRSLITLFSTKNINLDLPFY